MYTENKITYKGYRITTGITEYWGESPREWDNLGRIVAFHGDYNLPNEAEENISADDFSSWMEMSEYIQKKQKPVVMLSVRAYDHSGISFSTSGNYPYNDAWDSYQVGFIYATEEAIKEWLQIKSISKEDIKRVKKILEEEIATYTQYFNGEIYEYIVEKPETYTGKESKKEITIYDIVDSCTGFYSEEEAITEAKSYIDSLK